MAKATAPSRGGFTAVHVWMIGFVFLWLASTVLLVWLYTDQEAISNEVAGLRSTNSNLTRDRNEASDQLAELAVLAVGEESDDVAVVQAKASEFLDRIASDGYVEDTTVFEVTELLPAMDALYANFKSERERRLAAEERAQDAEGKLQEQIASHEKLKEDFDVAASALKGRVDDIEAGRSSYAADRDREVDDFENKMDEINQRFSRESQERRNQIASEVERREHLEKRYADLQAKVGELQITPGELLSVRTADGQIVKAIPEEGVVYIGLGREHQLTNGLRFAVYPSTGIPPDGRAKGRIEVLRIHDRTAECEVVALAPSEVILEGDLIANPVYNRDRPLRFVVVGKFDLNADGRDDAGGADRVAGIVRDWGGEVLEALTSRADFVVAGFAPIVPSEVSPDAARRDPGSAERHRLVQTSFDQYERTVSAAAELSIPILTQDVLLRFLGY